MLMIADDFDYLRYDAARYDAYVAAMPLLR